MLQSPTNENVRNPCPSRYWDVAEANIPWPTRECSERNMYAASARSSGGRPSWAYQYCMTIAMLAAPQPSGDCLKYGTSSQTPLASSATTEAQSSTATATCRVRTE